jgi:ribosomal protein L34E
MAEENPHPLPHQVQRSAPLRARSRRCWCCREPGPEIVHDYMKPQKCGPGPSQCSVELQGRPTTVAGGHLQTATLLRKQPTARASPSFPSCPYPALTRY